MSANQAVRHFDDQHVGHRRGSDQGVTDRTVKLSNLQRYPCPVRHVEPRMHQHDDGRPQQRRPQRVRKCSPMIPVEDRHRDPG